MKHLLKPYNNSTNSTRQEVIRMANQHQLDLLTQGREAWNAWRQQHPDVQPDFSHARLRGARLGGVDLNGASFREADLSGADFAGATRVKADLSGADLTGVCFRGADLSEANFSGADMRLATLEGADLSGVDLTNTKK